MQKDIQESNKLIAEFMGVTNDLAEWMGNTKRLQTNIRYHEDWNVLMPVVERIESMNWSTGINYIPGIGHSFSFLSAGVELNPSRVFSSKIEATYSAVIQFITWYNTQTTCTPQH